MEQAVDLLSVQVLLSVFSS